MRKKYVVELTKEERERLLKLIRAGEAPARMLNRVRILLKTSFTLVGLVATERREVFSLVQALNETCTRG